MLKSIRFDLMIALPALLLASFIGVFSLAHAQVGVEVGGSADTSVSGSVGDTDADTNASNDTRVDVGGDADTSTDAGSDTDADGSNVSAGTGAGIGSTLQLGRDDIDASIDVSAQGGVAANASTVVSDDDLRAYVSSTIQQDTNIEEVEASSESIAVQYRVPARFLGIIPSSLTANAQVQSDGTVTVDYPWYRMFFALGNSADVEARLTAEVQELMASAQANGSISASLGAQLVDRITAAFSASGSAAATAGE